MLIDVWLVVLYNVSSHLGLILINYYILFHSTSMDEMNNLYESFSQIAVHICLYTADLVSSWCKTGVNRYGTWLLLFNFTVNK